MNTTWLILDDSGTIVAIVAAEKTQVEQMAQAMSAHAEQTSNVEWHVGEHVPIWHG